MIINDGHDDNPTLEESTPRVSALSTYRGIGWSLCGAVLIKYMWQGSKKNEKIVGALPHIWGSLTTYLREPYHIFEGVLPHIWGRSRSLWHSPDILPPVQVDNPRWRKPHHRFRPCGWEEHVSGICWNENLLENFQKSVRGNSLPFPSLYSPQLSSSSASLWWWREPTPPKKLVSPSSNDASSVNVHHGGTREIYLTLLCMFNVKKESPPKFLTFGITLGPGVFLACGRKL